MDFYNPNFGRETIAIKEKGMFYNIASSSFHNQCNCNCTELFHYFSLL